MIRISDHFEKRLRTRFQMSLSELKNEWKQLEKTQIKFIDKNSKNENQLWFRRLKEKGEYIVLIKSLNMVIIHRDQTWTTCFKMIE